MTISSSLNAGVMGLNVNASRLSTISDNIANSATHGYKRSDVDFSSLVVTQSNSVYSAGGVRASSYKNVSDVGSLTSTKNATDIAVNGSGMIPVTNIAGLSTTGEDRDFMMVPTGSFSPDEDGFLKTTSGLYLLGWPTDAEGNVTGISRSNPTSLVPINTNVGTLTASATTEIDLNVNLPADTAVGASPFTLPIEYFDSLGLSSNLQLSFTKNADPSATTSSWTVNIIDEANSPTASVATFDVIFNKTTTAGGSVNSITPGAGATYDAATQTVSFTTASGTIDMKLGASDDSTGMTQLGKTFSHDNITKNGAPVGDVIATEINSEGILEAVYNSGFRRALFKIPAADVTNPNGLSALGNQAFQTSSSSGDVYLWDAGTGPTGSYAGYTLMESNTDIAAELTALIETQRAYSSNAKIIQTVDEMLQETTNLKR